MSRYQEIIKASRAVDDRWVSMAADRLDNVRISFPVPSQHARYSDIQRYTLELGTIGSFSFGEDDFVIMDSALSSKIPEQRFASVVLSLTPDEKKLKNKEYIDTLISEMQPKGKRVVAVGGGIILNVSSYIAEQLNLDLVYFPSTIIAMSDSSIGGKVRVNEIQDGKHKKHAYKSFYEPSHIVLDPSFLDSLKVDQIQVGLAEVIKHGVYQSRMLGAFLASDEFSPFEDRKGLLKAILWTADLKRVCIEVDPEERADGARQILRAAHDISDQLEEESGLVLPHGEAVIKAMARDLANDPERKVVLAAIYRKLGISTIVED